MRLALVPLLTVFVCTLIASCNVDECHDGEVQCDDNTARNCYSLTGQGNRWRSEPCGARTCIFTEGANVAALCVLSTSIEPRCVPADISFCDGANLVACAAGRRSDQTSCGSADACIEQVTRPSFCRANAPVNAPSCSAGGRTGCTTRYGACYRYDDAGCRASFITHCEDGFLREGLCPGEQSCKIDSVCAPDSQIAAALDSGFVAVISSGGSRPAPPVSDGGSGI